MKRAGKRYTRRMLIASVLYTAVIVAGVYSIAHFDLPRWAIIVAALAPLAPALLMLRAYVTFVGEVDEFQRRIQSEAVLIAAGVVGFGTFAYGFLEEWAGFPHLPLIWVLPSLIAAWGVALFFVRQKYK
jgi:hypothetical protein